jgi:hypothetical protein
MIHPLVIRIPGSMAPFSFVQCPAGLAGDQGKFGQNEIRKTIFFKRPSF